SHGDQVGETPPNFITLAHTDNCPIASMAGKIESDEYNKIAIQFHPEVTHTTHGKEILKNFALNICHAEQNWTTGHFIDETTEAIRKTVGTEQVLCAVSGGVDSSVVAALVHKAIGSQLHCFFVDNGLLRKNEVEQVKKSFGSLNIPLHVISAEQRFLTKLAGVIDPEKKRKIIGNEFVAIFEEEAKSIPNVTFLSQGTLYPDVIESKTSASKAGDKIKTHHNVGGLPENMKLKLLEPLRTLFKDEVRALGRKLGLAAELVDRHPFPGPGLAVRVLGDITKDKLDILREADAILIDELRKNNLYHSIWQAFAVLTPLQSVGVMGDERTYQNLLALRMITSEDGMTAEWAKVPFEILETISSRIVNEVRGINRVVYDITTKPPATIEWE
ncbi:MAG: glutamine-hydrolyzing GMP synthase, partial [bacterium]